MDPIGERIAGTAPLVLAIGLLAILPGNLFPAFAQQESGAVPVKVLAQEEPSEDHSATLPSPALDGLEDMVQEHIIEAQEATAKVLGDPDAALRQRALMLWELGLIYHAYNFNDAAQVCCGKALALEDSVMEIHYTLGRVLQSCGDFAGALLSFEAAHALQPNTALTAIRTGECHRSLNRFEEARESFSEALRLDPGGVAVRARLGELALAEKKYEEAVELLTAALEERPEADRLHYPLAMAYRGLGDMVKARAHLAKRGKAGIQPPDPLTRYLNELVRGSLIPNLRGRRAYAAGRPGEAAQAFLRAARADPENLGAKVNQAASLARQRDYEAAVELLREVLEREPGNLTAHFNLGTILACLGMTADAIGHLEIVVEKEPEDATAHFELGKVLRRQLRLDAALAHYASAVRLEPAMAAGWLEMAQLLELAKRYQETLQVLEEAHTHLPRDGAILLNLARFLSASPDPGLRNGKRGLQLAQVAFEREPTHFSASTVAMAYAELGQFAEASQWQRKAIELAAGAEASPETLSEHRQRLEKFEAKAVRAVGAP